ncbi:hypothetical protein HAX54_003803, partial [Datura stramonium]|nr:hypothetical protein [Datura stramonium]
MRNNLTLSDSQSSLNMKPYGYHISDTHLAKRKLQFSKDEVQTLTHKGKDVPDELGDQ